MNTKPILRRLFLLGAVWCLGFTPLAKAQTNYERIKSFGFPGQSVPTPNPVIEGSDGVLYGTSQSGGINGAGTVFKVSKDGSGYLVIYHFQSGAGSGSPRVPVLEGSDGALYGTAGTNLFKLNKDGTGFTTFLSGMGTGLVPLIEATDGTLYGVGTGTNNTGSVFKINKDGSSYSNIYNFPAGWTANTLGLLQANDGFLYGFGANQLFKLNKNGTGFAILHTFDSSLGSTDGFSPTSLILGTDGKLYGTTSVGGVQARGTVFRLNTDGTGYGILQSFFSTPGFDNGYGPLTIVEGGDGVLYGTTGDNAFTATEEPWIFRLNKDGSGFSLIYALSASGQQGRLPYGLIVGQDGKLYATAKEGGDLNLGALIKVDKSGANFTRLVSFSSTGNDGTKPEAGLLEGSDGALYGTTERGGERDSGTIYKMNKDGSGYTAFSLSTNNAGGRLPVAELIEGRDGALYGTTIIGGTSNYGTVFRIARNLTGITTLHNFSLSGGDARSPNSQLLQASDGMLYGMAPGGTNGEGAIFKLNTNGSGYGVLKNFPAFSLQGNAEGRTLVAGLIEGTDGVLYGTASSGGVTNRGTVFKLNKDGTGFTVLRHFLSAPDGGSPQGELLEGSDGAIYGTTRDGGTGNRGTVFKVNKDGTGYSIVRSFTGSTDGDRPISRLLERPGGTLYGLTEMGGTGGQGTVFKLNKDGSGYAIVQHFLATGTGSRGPRGNMVLGNDGAFYGTSFSGGDMLNYGTVFKIDPAVLRISPPTATAAPGTTVNFNGIEGVPPYVFTLATNNTGGSITASGLYTAGSAGCAPDTVRITDASNHTAFATVSTDTTAPSITCPANIVVVTNRPNLVVTFPSAPTATDNCTAAPVIVCAPASGSNFRRGTTNVICWATDSAGNSNSCSFLVTVTNFLALAISPTTRNVAAGGTVAFTAVGGTPPYTFSIPTNNSGGSIATNGLYTAGLGCVTDAVRVTDFSNNTATAFVRTDNTAPTITCPPNILIEDPAVSVPVTFTVTATDDCAASPLVVCTPASGSLFAHGATSVICRATDGLGNSNSCSFLVVITSATDPALTISPTNVNVGVGGYVEFFADGGTPPYTYSLATNNSGGSIFSGGVFGDYIAGPAPLTDVVRVIDAANHTATATVTVRLIVPGTATPYLAGLPDGTLSTTNAPEHADVAPDQSPVLVPGLTWPMPPNRALSFRASGGVLHYTGSPVVPPDGTIGNIFGHWGGAEHGIADFQIPVNALVGIFLGADSPEATPAPARLDFTSDGSRDYALLEPLLKQVFFIGDGLTSGGQPQLVRPPTSATRLYLATVDSYGWWNNVGSFTVSLNVSNISNPSAPLVISPATTNALAGAAIVFTASGGLAPYQFTFATNDSGGTLTSGSYIAGPLAGTDAVLVTDAAGSNALAFVMVTANTAPSVANAIPAQAGAYGAVFQFTFAADVFTDPDAGQSLAYTATNQPPGVGFDAVTRTFSGTNGASGVFAVNVIATDNGVPPRSGTNTFALTVNKAPLTITANNTNRPYGEANPAFTGALTGLLNLDNITATFDTPATPASAPGSYPIAPVLTDPDTRLGHYAVTTNLGTLTIQEVRIESSLTGATATLSWPTGAVNLLLECTASLEAPVTWQPVTSGITITATNISYTVLPVTVPPSRFYRLRVP